MSRFEIAICWVTSWAFVLVVVNLLINKYERYIDGKEVAVKGVQPQIEVYGKNYKKKNAPGRTFDKTI